jgi:hypothetical protein
MKQVVVSLVACGLMSMVNSLQAVPLSYSYGGNLYQLVNADSGQPGNEAGQTLRTWETAQASAEALGAGWNLVTINDAQENAWLLQTFMPYVNIAAFIGLYQAPEAGEPDQGWGWISGETASFRNWNDPTGSGIEPNNEGGNESWGAMYFYGVNTDWMGKWNDVPDKSKSDSAYSYGIAEYSPTAVPDGGLTLGLLGLAVAGLGILRRKMM